MKLKELEKLSPCPIKYTPDLWFSFGEFRVLKGIFNCQIVVRDGMDEAKTLGALAHEIGHALCYSKKCKCMKDAHEPGDHLGSNAILAEYHAIKFCLSWLLKNKQKEALAHEIELIKKDSVNKFSAAHKGACKKIMKLKLWQKILDFVEEN